LHDKYIIKDIPRETISPQRGSFNMEENSNNNSESKNYQTIDNLITTDNLLKKHNSSYSGENTLEKNSKIKKQNTLMVSEMIDQLSRFNNYTNGENEKKNFYSKIENYTKKLTIESNNNNMFVMRDNNLMPTIINIKITHAEKKSMQYRVFWNKEKIEDMRKKFRMAKEKIKLKTELFFKKIEDAIKKGDREKIL